MNLPLPNKIKRRGRCELYGIKMSRNQLYGQNSSVQQSPTNENKRRVVPGGELPGSMSSESLPLWYSRNESRRHCASSICRLMPLPTFQPMPLFLPDSSALSRQQDLLLIRFFPAYKVHWRNTILLYAQSFQSSWVIQPRVSLMQSISCFFHAVANQHRPFEHVS